MSLIVIVSGLPMGVVFRMLCNGCGPLSSASARICAALPICLASESRFSADPRMPLTNASLKLRNPRKRSTCFAHRLHQTLTALFSTISASIHVLFGSSAHFHTLNVFSETPAFAIVYGMTDAVLMRRLTVDWDPQSVPVGCQQHRK